MEKIMENKWCYSIDGEKFIGQFDSRDKVIEALKRMRHDVSLWPLKQLVWVGKWQVPKAHVEAEGIVGQVAESFYDECGKVADTWVPTQEDIGQLQEHLNFLMDWWVTRTNNKPTFHKVADIEEFYVLVDSAGYIDVRKKV